MEQLINELTPYIIGILTILLGYASTLLKSYIDSKIDKDNQEKIVKFVQSNVAYVEQIGVELPSEEKLDLAKRKFLLWANEKGITVSEIDLEVLIESFVNGLKGE